MRARIHDHRSLLATFAIALIGGVLVLSRSAHYGPGVTSDSVNYLVAARSLARTGELVSYRGHELVDWPPLFPALLAIRAPTTLEAALGMARWLNVGCFVGIIVMAGFWLRSLGLQPWLSVAGTVVVAIGPPLVSVASFAWSEPLFILLCLLALRSLERACRAGSGLPLLLLASTLVALATMTRYVGAALIVVGGVMLILPAGRLSRQRLIRLGLFTIVAAGPLLLWMGRNLAVADTAAGKRPISTATPQSMVSAGFRTLGSWIAPATLPSLLRVMVGGAVLAGVIVLALTRPRRQPRAAASPAHLLPVVLFLVLYSAAIAASEIASRVDLPNDRILSPIFVPLVLLAVWLLNQANALRVRAVVMGVWLVALSWGAVTSYTTARRDGAGGYSARRWRESTLVDTVRRAPPRGVVYTNVPAAVYYLAGQLMIRMPAPPSFGGDPDALPEMRRLAKAAGHVTVVWFNRGPADTYRPRDLQPRFQLVTETVAADGVVYRVAAR